MDKMEKATAESSSYSLCLILLILLILSYLFSPSHFDLEHQGERARPHLQSGHGRFACGAAGCAHLRGLETSISGCRAALLRQRKGRAKTTTLLIVLRPSAERHEAHCEYSRSALPG